jgi:hypothetical protein
MDSATGSIYLGDSGVDRHLIIRNTHSIFSSSWSHALLPSFRRSTQFVSILTHSCEAFIDPCNLCGSSWPGILSYLTLFLRSSSQNRSFSRIPFGYHARCGGVFMMGCLPSSSTVSPHRDRVNLEMHSEAVTERVWRPESSEFGDTLDRASLEMHLEAVIVQTWRT